MSSESTRHEAPWWHGALVALLALVVFLPALRVGFVIDDEAQVLQNPAVREMDLGKIFGQGYWANASESAERIDAGGDREIETWPDEQFDLSSGDIASMHSGPMITALGSGSRITGDPRGAGRT